MLHQTGLPAPVGARDRAATTAGSGRFRAGLVLLLVLGLLVRLPFLPRLGHAYDADAYRQWMGAIQDHGLAEVFDRTNTDYVGYHYILWALGKGYGGRASEVTVRDKALRVWLKLPGLAGDLLVAILIAGIARSVAARRPVALGARWHNAAGRLRCAPADLAGLAAAALFLFQPAVLYAGSYWGQQDSLIAFFMLLACWLAWRRQPAWAAAALAAGTIVKPQPLVLVPLLAWLVWQRSSWPGLGRAALAGLAVLVAGHAYFIATGNAERVWGIYTFQLTTNEHLSFAAYNLWWPFERLLDARPRTAIVSLGPLSLTYGLVASALVLALLLLTWKTLRHGVSADHDRGDLGVLLAVGYFLAGYFLVAAAVHERYALPVFAFLLPALAFTPRLRWPLLLFSLIVALNLLVSLPLDRRWSQGDPLWLSIAASGVAVVAVVWMGWVVATAAPTPGPSPADAGEGCLNLAPLPSSRHPLSSEAGEGAGG